MADVFRQASVTRFDRKRDGANLGFVAQSFILLALAVTPLNKQNDACANPVVKRAAYRFDHQPQNLLLRLPNVLPTARQTDWQVTTRRKSAQNADAPNLLLSTLAAVGPAPFAQFDWPNPHRAKRIVTAKHVRGSFNAIGAVVPTAPPFNQSDWPNPVRPKNLLAAHALYVTSYAPPLAPFAHVDWPNPNRRKWYQPEQLIPNLLSSTLAQVVAGSPPFNQVEWANPGRRKSVQQNDSPNLLLSTFVAAAPPPPPFYQNEWPNPNRRAAHQHRDSGNLLLSTLGASVVVAPPFNQTDWYTPAKKRWAQSGDAANLLTTTLQVQPPFSQTEWANPARKARFDVSGSCVSLSFVLTQPSTAPPVIYTDRVIAAHQPSWILRAEGRYVGR